MLDLDRIAELLLNYPTFEGEVDNALINDLYAITESPDSLAYIAGKIGEDARDEGLEFFLYGA